MNSTEVIESSRLKLIPLNLSQLLLLSQGRKGLEHCLGIEISSFELNSPDSFLEEFHKGLKNYVIPNVEKNESEFQWFTHWLMVHKELNLTIGGLGVAGLPDENGEVYLGYFVDKKFEGKGFATEAVESFIRWIFQNPKVKTVIADTLVANNGSQNVLQKNGFVFVAQVEEGLRWKRDRL